MAKKPARKSRSNANGSKRTTNTKHPAAKTPPVDAVADAEARYAAKTKADKAALLADPVVKAEIENGKRWDAAQRDAADAAAPYRAELDRLIAANPRGYIPESETAHRIEALKSAIQDAELTARTQHGFSPRKAPANPTQLLKRLRAIALDWQFDLGESADHPRPTDLLWGDAEGLRKRDPFLAALPAEPDDGRQRYAALVRWCEDCIARGLAELEAAFDRYYKTLDAATVSAADGGRIVAGPFHAVALSEATDALYRELAAAYQRVILEHGQPIAEYPLGMMPMESDSPDGPWTPIPASDVRTMTVSIGGDGADALLLAALASMTGGAAFPNGKWNAMQAARPGANHQRYHAGDVVSAKDLAALESAAKLLRLKAPPSANVAPKLPALPNGVETDEPAVPTLTLIESRVLQTMARFDGLKLLSNKMIEEEMDAEIHVSERSIGPIVRKFIELRWAERPDGNRKGARLTLPGRRIASKIAD